jgi:hypothetical protein
MYRFMSLGGYGRKWRAFVPLWNIFIMYDLANAGRGNFFWILLMLPAVLVIRSIWVVLRISSAEDTPELSDFIAGYYTDLGQEVIAVDRIVTYGLWALFLVPAFVLLPIVGGRLAIRSGLPRWAGVVAAIPGVWLAGLPALAFSARTNTGLPAEILPLPPFVDASTQPGRRPVQS